jgi:DNA-binding transcriptional regulator YdaS (Cro superfamily)
MTLSEYIRAARGNAVALAAALGVHKTQISNWANPKNTIPPARCVEIEKVTGVVTRKDLRPDDWETIWPELATPCSGKKTPRSPTSHPAERAGDRK